MRTIAFAQNITQKFNEAIRREWLERDFFPVFTYEATNYNNVMSDWVLTQAEFAMRRIK